MSFQKGIHYPHPPRGPGRGRYHMSDEARRARMRNLKRARIRSDRETAIIKRLIWQACFESGLRPSQRTLSRQLGVWRSYVHKVQKQALSVGMDALLREERVTPADLEKARQFTAKLREMEPGLLAPAPPVTSTNEPRPLTLDESIARTWREVEDWKRKHPSYGWRRVLFRVPVR